MFSRIQGLLSTLFTDMQTTFIWIFIIGMIFCGIMLWQGGEENAPKFKKSLIGCGIGLVIFLLAKPIIEYVQTNL